MADTSLEPYRKKRSAAAAVAEQASQTLAPYAAMVEVADRCNEACVHCYQVQGQKGEIGTEEWEARFPSKRHAAVRRAPMMQRAAKPVCGEWRRARCAQATSGH